MDPTTFNLWPTPGHPPSRTSPARLAATPESTKTLLEVLNKNHEKWHVFFDDFGRHNHISHHVLAVWALGAHEDVVRAGYDKNEWIQRPRGSSPGPVTKENFNDHLGDHRFYDAYLNFFAEIVRTEGYAKALEDYVFSPKANFSSTNKDDQPPEMVSRLAAGLLHAHIHVGYGAEFGLPGMFVEGLAMAAISPANTTALIPPALFTATKESIVHTASDTLNKAGARLQNVLVSLGGNAPSQAPKNVHVFDILSRIGKDPRMESPQVLGVERILSATMEQCGDAIFQYANQWTIDTSDPTSIEQKVEELQWAATLMYAVPGFKQIEGGEFNADFLAMHFVTSALFLPSLAAYLSPASQAVLLRSYLAISLAWWIAIGRPPLHIGEFFAADTAHPAPSGTQPTLHKHALSSPNGISNPWLPIIQDAIMHPDDHVPKCLRALFHYGTLYGARPRGFFASTELDGAERLDGTLFVRAAGLTMQRLSRPMDKVPKLQIYWDRRTFIPGAPEDSY